MPRRLPQYRTLANLFKRRKLYASVILFRSQKDATSALSLVNIAYSGKGAFVVNIKEWCRPEWSKYPATLSGINYYDCRRGDILDGNTGVIIIKKFKTSKAAQEYLEGLLKKQFPSRQYDFVTFYLQKGKEIEYQAAIINYKNQNEANKQINQIPENLRKEATAVDINKFCPSMSRVQDSYYECK